MLFVQTVISISSMVLQNCLFNNMCKKELTTNDHIYRFNTIMYAVCIVLFGIGALGGQTSFFTIVLGLLFGVVTALSNFYKMRALNSGPMHITLLVTTSSMIIPTMCGIFFGERFSVLKLILVVILIGFIFLSFDKTDNKKTNKKWLFFCVPAFLFQGSIGVLQKIHQFSAYKGELNGFLFVAFVCSLIYSRIRAQKSYRELSFRKKQIIFAIMCGVCTYIMNFLNLRLSGLLPSQLFFPLVNGSAIVLSSVMSVLLFKEHLSKKQTLGLIGGITTLILMCLVG